MVTLVLLTIQEFIVLFVETSSLEINQFLVVQLKVTLLELTMFLIRASSIAVNLSTTMKNILEDITLLLVTMNISQKLTTI